ncbi:MAG: hypothetical protein KDD53_01270 [Bdellovibrionales bacterium]|nr:hypothetical protein [Bdellovibrionales bacterium]
MKQQRENCKNCGIDFEISIQDAAFYTRMAVLRPTHCYLCRMQRRLAYRNERFLYHRKCDLSKKQIISSFSLDKPFPVYDNEVWWSDDWSALSYGRDFDFTRPFFDQFFELRDRVPRLALQQQKPMENSRYCNCASRNRNCYLVFSTNECEDCYYGSWVNNSRNCIDNLNIEHCELCYECVGCVGCYTLLYSRDCIDCSDSYFLRDCLGCRYCFGCSSLVNREYCFFNEQLSESEYKERVAALDLGSRSVIEYLKNEIPLALGPSIVKSIHGARIENSSGDYLTNCKGALNCFECDSCEDLSYCMCVQNAKSCMDFSYWGGNAELIYESQACGYDIFNLRFCNLCWSGCSDLTYSDHCFASKNCFGCVGLKREKYCILNKQYTPEAYSDLSAKIVEHMKETGEWGEFFPVSKSIYAYNETLAYEQIPVLREVVLKKGWTWIDSTQRSQGSYIGPDVALPENISELDDAVCSKILHCKASNKAYKIIPQELDFYRKLNVPPPELCPDERHLRRLSLRNKRAMWNRECASCNDPIETTYSPDCEEKVYCEPCYRDFVYGANES